MKKPKSNCTYPATIEKLNMVIYFDYEPEVPERDDEPGRDAQIVLNKAIVDQALFNAKCAPKGIAIVVKTDILNLLSEWTKNQIIELILVNEEWWY